MTVWMLRAHSPTDEPQTLFFASEHAVERWADEVGATCHVDVDDDAPQIWGRGVSGDKAATYLAEPVEVIE